MFVIFFTAALAGDVSLESDRQVVSFKCLLSFLTYFNIHIVLNIADSSNLQFLQYVF